MGKEAFIGTIEEGKGRKGKFLFPIESLRKHFFCLGSSGSGKTVLSKVLVEEVALHSIPSIVVDPQGDLASLALSADPEEAEKHGLDKASLSKFADSVSVTVFTPISSKGVPICLNPLDIGSLAFSREEVIPILHQISSSIVRLLGYNPLNDKGKAAETVLYTILEECHDKRKKVSSFANLASILSGLGPSEKARLRHFVGSDSEIDLLVRKIKYLTVGEKELLFSFGVPLDIGMLLGKGRHSPGRTQVSIIYLNTLASQEEKEFFISILATRLYQWMLQHPSSGLNCLFMIDEISPFIPAGSEKPIPKPILKLVFKQARKYGVGCVIATQNPGDIDYKAFAQFGTWALGRMTVRQDIKKVENALKSMSNVGISKGIPGLKPGEFLIFAPDLYDRLLKIKVRRLLTKHTTMTDSDVSKITSNEVRERYRPFMLELSVRSNAGGASGKGVAGSAISSGKEDSLSPHIARPPGYANGLGEKAGTAETADTAEKTDVSYRGSMLSEEMKERHFRLMVGEADINRLIEKNRRKYFLVGPPKEELASYSVALRPLYLIKCSTSTRNLLGKLRTNVFDTLVDGISGGLFVFRKGKFYRIQAFSGLLSLGENELYVLRYLADSRLKKFPADISLKTGLSRRAVSKALKSLIKNSLVAYEKVGRDQRFMSIIDLPEKGIADVSSEGIELTKKKIKASILKPRFSAREAGSALRGWFGVMVVNEELIYLPVIMLKYSGSSGIRKVELNGMNGKPL